MQFAHPLAAECRLIRAGYSLGILALAMGMLSGCGRSADSPMTRANRHFQDGQFDQAIDVLERAISASPDSAGAADMLALKGRCYWELAYRTERVDTRAALLQNAVTTLTQSIETEDNAEARHLRALVYESIEEDQLAAADKTAARELDETYRRAYLNEKPDEVLLDRSDLPPAPNLTAAKEAKDANSKETKDDLSGRKPDNGFPAGEFPLDAQDPAEEDSLSPPSSRRGSVSRSGDLPWTQAIPDLGRDGNSGLPRRRSPSGLPSTRELGRGGRSGLARNPNDRSWPTEQDEGPDSDDAAEDDSEQTTPEDESDAEITEREPLLPQRPSSTWQPLMPPTMFSHPAMRAPPSTGLVGPPLDGQSSGSAGEATSPFGNAPTTGITGPPGFSSFSPPTQSTPGRPAVPTTGIGGAPVQPPMPSGLPAQFAPPMGSTATPGLPFTGALPQQFQPQGVWGFGGGGIATGVVPAFPTNGPNYSPLYPSPLTVPDARRLGQPIQRPAVPTTPSAPPSTAQPRRTTTPSFPQPSSPWSGPATRIP
jgi:hypothetical protein